MLTEHVRKLQSGEVRKTFTLNFGSGAAFGIDDYISNLFFSVAQADRNTNALYLFTLL